MMRVIRNKQDLDQLTRYLGNRELPVTVSIAKGARRSNKQNKTLRLWMGELEAQGDMTAEQYRAYCKLHFGVPILREAHAEFQEQYDRIVKPLPYESKLALMMEPIDFPVTRLMTTAQEKQMLDEIYVHFTGHGFHLTEPGSVPVELYEREAG